MNRIPARLMPAYHAELWVVRGHFHRTYQKTKLVTGASKPKRISKNVARLLKIRLSTNAAGANWFPAEEATANKRTNATAVAHSLRSRTRRRTRTNRAASQKIGAVIKAPDISAIIARAPRNCQSGPGCGCSGG